MFKRGGDIKTRKKGDFMLNKNTGPFRPIDSRGNKMVLDGDIYKSELTNELISSDGKLKTVDLESNSLESIADFHINNNVMEEELLFLENRDEFVPEVDDNPIAHNKLFYVDGGIIANENLFNQIDQKIKDSILISDDEKEYYQQYMAKYEPYKKKSLYYIDVEEDDFDARKDEEEQWYFERRMEEEEEARIKEEIEYQAWLEEKEAEEEKKRREQEEEDLMLFYFDSIGY